MSHGSGYRAPMSHYYDSQEFHDRCFQLGQLYRATAKPERVVEQAPAPQPEPQTERTEKKPLAA